LVQFLGAKGIFEAVEGKAMVDGGELTRRPFPNPLGGTIGGDQLRILAF